MSASPAAVAWALAAWAPARGPLDASMTVHADVAAGQVPVAVTCLVADDGTVIVVCGAGLACWMMTVVVCALSPWVAVEVPSPVGEGGVAGLELEPGGEVVRIWPWVRAVALLVFAVLELSTKTEPLRAIIKAATSVPISVAISADQRGLWLTTSHQRATRFLLDEEWLSGIVYVRRAGTRTVPSGRSASRGAQLDTIPIARLG